jgi:hypothetical protein
VKLKMQKDKIEFQSQKRNQSRAKFLLLQSSRPVPSLSSPRARFCGPFIKMKLQSQSSNASDTEITDFSIYVAAAHVRSSKGRPNRISYD